MYVANQGGVQELLGIRPKLVAGLALPCGVGDEASDQLQDVLFAVDVRERVVPHGLLKVDGIQHPNLEPCALQQAPCL